MGVSILRLPEQNKTFSPPRYATLPQIPIHSDQCRHPRARTEDRIDRHVPIHLYWLPQKPSPLKFPHRHRCPHTPHSLLQIKAKSTLIETFASACPRRAPQDLNGSRRSLSIWRNRPRSKLGCRAGDLGLFAGAGINHTFIYFLTLKLSVQIERYFTSCNRNCTDNHRNLSEWWVSSINWIFQLPKNFRWIDVKWRCVCPPSLGQQLGILLFCQDYLDRI